MMVLDLRTRQIFVNLFHQGSIQGANMVLQLLLIPLVISRLGMEQNGLFLMSASIGALLSTLINFAGNQTIPQEKHDTAFILQELSVRSILFVFFAILIGIISLMQLPLSFYLLGILPLLLSEVLNPYAFLLAQSRLHPFNLANLFGRGLALYLTWQFLQEPDDTPWINAWVGLSLLPGYVILLLRYFKKTEKKSKRITFATLQNRFLQNVPLVGGNLVVNLQQSIMLYVLGGMGKPVLLGLYALADKLVWSARTLLIAFSNAIYPIVIQVANDSEISWKIFRERTNKILALLLFMGGILLMLLAPWLSVFFAKQGDPQMITIYLRWIAFVPMIMSLNVLNVLERLFKRDFKGQFKINLQLLFLSIILSFVFLSPLYFSLTRFSWMNTALPAYLLFMECITLWLYEKHRHRTG